MSYVSYLSLSYLFLYALTVSLGIFGTYSFFMTKGKQLQMTMRDMLFLTWAIEPDTARKLVDERLELDTRTVNERNEAAFVSAVCFHVSDVRSSVLPVPRLNFEQVNYRVYVKAGGVPAVYFLQMKVNSRMVTALTSFLSIPVHYDDIRISTSPGASGDLKYDVQSSGLRAAALIQAGKEPDAEDPQDKVPSSFFTQRLIGYMGVGNGMFRINVQQSGLDAVSARPQIVQAESLEQLGLLTREAWGRPYSVLYVREALFEADTPDREW
jgi:uncharacterized protein YqjF (DUF2071 family)